MFLLRGKIRFKAGSAASSIKSSSPLGFHRGELQSSSSAAAAAVELDLTGGCENLAFGSGVCSWATLLHRGLLLWSEIEHERHTVLLLFPVFVLGVCIYIALMPANGVVMANEKHI